MSKAWSAPGGAASADRARTYTHTHTHTHTHTGRRVAICVRYGRKTTAQHSRVQQWEWVTQTRTHTHTHTDLCVPDCSAALLDHRKMIIKCKLHVTCETLCQLPVLAIRTGSSTQLTYKVDTLPPTEQYTGSTQLQLVLLHVQGVIRRLFLPGNQPWAMGPVHGGHVCMGHMYGHDLAFCVEQFLSACVCVCVCLCVCMGVYKPYCGMHSPQARLPTCL